MGSWPGQECPKCTQPASAMPPPRCAGCNRSGSALAYGPENEKRCNSCYQAARRKGSGLPLWMHCPDCGVGPQACFPAAAESSGSDAESDTGADSGDSETESSAEPDQEPPDWRCARCTVITDLALAPQDVKRVWSNVPLAQALALYTAHIEAWISVDAWIVPSPRGDKRCLLIYARLVFWRRWGMLAGLVQGVTGAVRWCHGRRVVTHATMVTHLCALCDEGAWPRGNAPVLLTGWPGAELAPLRVLLVQSGFSQREAARLRALPYSLSERQRGVTKGLKLKAFLGAPSRPCWQECPLVRQCRMARAALGLPGGGACTSLAADTEKGRAFRRLLFPA